MRASIRDVAQRAGVSVSTASRALNNKPDVSKLVRARVVIAARELDYAANTHARALGGGRSRTLGLIYVDSGEMFFAAMARGVEDIATAHGYSIIVCNTDERIDLELQAHHMLREKRVDGVLTNSVQSGSGPLQQLAEEKIPCVLLNRVLSDFDADYVSYDMRCGAYEATAHLCRLGHRRILHQTGNDHRYAIRQRLEGYQQALADNDIPFDPKLVLRCSDLSLNAVYADLKRSLPLLDPRPTAIFAYNDRMTLPMLSALAELNLCVPEDISLVGYDDLEYAPFVRPALTTVSQPASAIGKLGAQVLIEKINWPVDEPWTPRHILLKPELVVRASSGQPLAA